METGMSYVINTTHSDGYSQEPPQAGAFTAMNYAAWIRLPETVIWAYSAAGQQSDDRFPGLIR